MSPEHLLWPVMAQVALTLVVYVRLAAVKRRALASGSVDLERRGLHADAWPDDVLKVSNNLRNQFESPMLFYALVLVALVGGAVNTVAVVFAWAFVTCRLVHFYIHTGPNTQPWRFRAFTAGIVCLGGLLVVCARSLIV